MFLSDRDIDKVDDLMAEITEQQEVAQEISDVISRPVGFGEDYDEVRTEDVFAESERLDICSKQIEMRRSILNRTWKRCHEVCLEEDLEMFVFVQ